MSGDFFSYREFEALLEQEAKRANVKLKETPRELALYMTERAVHLSRIAGEPGIEEAIIAERDSIALAAGLKFTDLTRAGDQYLIGVIQGALTIALRMLAG